MALGSGIRANLVERIRTNSTHLCKESESEVIDNTFCLIWPLQTVEFLLVPCQLFIPRLVQKEFQFDLCFNLMMVEGAISLFHVE